LSRWPHQVVSISLKAPENTKEQNTNDNGYQNKYCGEQARGAYTLHHRYGESDARKH
jgi:hypothetical protein